MTFSVHGLAVARGIAIGRAVLMASSRVDVTHYFIQPQQIDAEIDRLRAGRNAVVEEIHRLQTTIGAIVECLAERSGAPQPRLVLPYVIPYFGCVLFEMLQRLHLRSKPGPIDRAGLRFLGTSRSVSIRRAQAELGFAPQVFFREGIAAMLQETEKKP